MRTEGIRGSYVAATSGVPLPSTVRPSTPTEGLVTCARCDLRTRPGAFHICLEPAAPEPVAVPKPKERPEEPPKPKKRRGGKPALNEEQSIEAVQMYVEQGLSLLDVANHFGISPNSVNNTLRRLGVPRRTPGAHSPRGGGGSS